MVISSLAENTETQTFAIQSSLKTAENTPPERSLERNDDINGKLLRVRSGYSLRGGVESKRALHLRADKPRHRVQTEVFNIGFVKHRPGLNRPALFQVLRQVGRQAMHHESAHVVLRPFGNGELITDPVS